MIKLNEILANLSVVTFVISIVSLLAIMMALYLYRPQIRFLRYGGIIILSLVVIGSAGFQVLGSYKTSTNTNVNNDLLEQYKLADWVIHADQTTRSLHVKHVWQENPTLENKLFYMFSLIKNNDLSRGKHILEEVIDETDAKSMWIDHESLKTLLGDIETYGGNQDARENNDNHPEFITMIDQQLEIFKTHIANTEKVDTRLLEQVTQFDIDRVQSLASSGDEEVLSQIRNDLNQALNNQDEAEHLSPLIKKEMAKVSLFFGDTSRSEKLLLDVVLEQPADEEAVVLLTEIYLRGDVRPSEEAQKLPQYHHAELLAAREKMNSFEEWKTQINMDQTLIRDDQKSEGERNEERPDYLFNNDEILANELTYTLIQSMDQSTNNPDLAIRLSRYHFNKGKNDQAKKQIQTVLKNSEKLPTEEQYMINAIEYHDQKLKQSADMTAFTERQGHLQEIYHSKEDLFNSFHTPSYRMERNIADESYEHFLAESIRNPQDKNLSIMTIDAMKDGSVSMYVHAENISSINKKEFSISDNGEQIEDFTIEKIGEHTNEGTFDRSIGLVIDVSGSMAGERIKVARNSSKSFIHRLKDYEQAELVKFESFPTLVEAFTNSKQSLINGVNTLESDGGTNITDALLYEMDRIKNQDGHKVIFIFSDGEDGNFSRVESRTQVIDLANEYGISIFAVGFGAGYETLSEVANETGGMYIAAPNEATIDEGFKYVEQALADTYKVNYTLAEPTEGKHIVKIDYEGLSDKDHYYLGDNNQDIEFDVHDFKVFQLAPQVIYQSNGEDIKAKLSGKNLTDIESVSIANEEIKIDKIINDELVELHIPGDLPLGQHILVAKGKGNEQSTTEFTVSKAEPKDEVPFGWATLYADRCKTVGNQVECFGQPTIDHFIYPEDPKMTLTNEESLSFSGASFKVDQSKLFFFKNDYGKDKQVMNGELVLTKADNHGEEFSLTYKDKNRLSIDKLGIEIEFKDITYTAKREKRPGTIKSESKFEGVSEDIFDLVNTGGSKILSKLAPFLSTELGLELTLSPTEANVKGEVDLGDLEWLGISMENPLSEVEYDDLNKRFSISGGFGNFKFLGQRIDAALPVSSASYTLGYEPKFKLRLGLTLNGNYPLGPTGLSLTKIGGHIDWTSRQEAGLEVAVGTIANKPVKELIKKLNKVKIAKFQLFKIDPKRADILSLEVEGEVTSVFTSDWEAAGKASGKVLGFEIVGMSGRVNNHLLQSEVNYKGHLDVEGEATVVYKDPSYQNNLVSYTTTKISKKLPFGVPLFAELDARLVPARISSSEFAVTGKAGPFEFTLSTEDLNLFK